MISVEVVQAFHISSGDHSQENIPRQEYVL